MKKQELQTLKTKEVKELTDMIAKKKQELSNAQIDLQAGRVKNVHVARDLRHDIARISTAIMEKKMEVQK